jgi:hypothetical protein
MLKGRKEELTYTNTGKGLAIFNNVKFLPIERSVRYAAQRKERIARGTVRLASSRSPTLVRASCAWQSESRVRAAAGGR